MPVAARNRGDGFGTWMSIGSRVVLLLLAAVTMVIAVAWRTLRDTLGGIPMRELERRFLPPALAALLAVWGLLPQGGAAAQGATPVVSAPSCRDQIRVVAEQKTWELRGDCMTDVPITVPDGGTFDGRGHTIRVVDPAGGRFAGGVIERRGGFGTVRHVVIDGSVLLSGCSWDSAVAGIRVEHAGGEVTDVTLTNLRRGTGEGCGWGIVVSEAGESPVVVRRSPVHHAGQLGIIVANGAHADVIDANRVVGGEVGIVFTGEGTAGTISGNTVQQAGIYGISAGAGATVTMTDNTIADALVGIEVVSGAKVEATGNLVANTELAGVRIEDSATANLVDNTVSRAADWGITVSGEGTTATITDNTVEDAGVEGIRIEGAAEASLSGNRVTGAGWVGIHARGLAVADVSGNTMQGPTALEPPLPRPVGIQFDELAAGRIKGNSVSQHWNRHPEGGACGIRVLSSVGEVDVSGNRFPAPGNESDVCDERQVARETVSTESVAP
jgi:parallel beta-helix repeat protein